MPAMGALRVNATDVLPTNLLTVNHHLAGDAHEAINGPRARAVSASAARLMPPYAQMTPTTSVGHDDEDRLAIAVALVEAVDATADGIVERGHGAGLKILLGNPGDIGQDTRTNHVDRLGVEDRQFEIGRLEIARLGFLVLPDEIILNRRAIAGGKVLKKMRNNVRKNAAKSMLTPFL